MNEASVYLLKQNNGTKEIFSNNFFLSTFESYYPLRENDPTRWFMASNYEGATRWLHALGKCFHCLWTMKESCCKEMTHVSTQTCTQSHPRREINRSTVLTSGEES